MEDNDRSEIDQLVDAILHIQECIKNLTRIFTHKSSGHKSLGLLKEELKKLESLTEEITDKR
jgi:hypothetical protein